jgi:hypothetical protein
MRCVWTDSQIQVVDIIPLINIFELAPKVLLLNWLPNFFLVKYIGYQNAINNLKLAVISLIRLTSVTHKITE